MTGLEFIENYPADIKEKITAEFKSIENLYKTIFELNNQQYNLYKTKPIDKQKISEIDNKLFDIEEKLEEFGIDGRDVTVEVSNDFGELMVKREVSALNSYLKQRGTDYNTMRKWLKDYFNVE